VKKIREDLDTVLHEKRTKAKALIALALVSFFWGTTWVASREGVKHMPALQLAAIRQFIGGIAYIIFFVAKGRAIPRGREWITILILTFLNFILSNTLSTWGLKYISAGLGSIIGATFPLWLMLIILVKSRSALAVRAVIGFILGFAGICVIFYEHIADFVQSEFRFGIFLSVAAAISWAFGTLYTKKKSLDFNPYFSLGLQMTISGLILYFISASTGISISIRSIPTASWIAILYLVIFSSILTFVAYLYALQRLPASRVAIYAYLNPVVAVVIESLFFGQPFSLYIGVGGLVTLVGVYLVNETFRTNSNAHELKEELKIER
jgi:drug/metabolite transporter (DMT)-like permease